MNPLKIKLIGGAAAAVVAAATGAGVVLSTHHSAPAAVHAAAPATATGSGSALPTFTRPSAGATTPAAAGPSAGASAAASSGSPAAGAGLGHVVKAATVPTFASRSAAPTVASPSPANPTALPTPTVAPPKPTATPTPTPTAEPTTPSASVSPSAGPTDDTPPPDAMYGQPADYDYPLEICSQVDTAALAQTVGYPMRLDLPRPTSSASATPSGSATAPATATATATATTTASSSSSSAAASSSTAAPAPSANGYCNFSTDPFGDDSGPHLYETLTAMAQPADSPYILGLVERSTPITPAPAGSGQAYVQSYGGGVYYYTWVDGPYAVTVTTTQIPDAQAQPAALPVARGVLDWLTATAPAHPTFPAADWTAGTETANRTSALAAGGTAAAGLLAIPGVWLYRRRRR